MIKQKNTTEGKEEKTETKKRVKKIASIEAPVEVAIEAPKIEKTPAEISEDEMIEAMIPEFPEEEGAEGKKRPDRYFEGVGRRKTAVARVRLFTKVGDFRVNDQLYTEFFKTLDQQKIAEEALQKMKLFGRFRVSVKVSGGGSHAQAEAVRHGLARCLVKFNPDFRKRLKRATFLKRDPRAKERKKFGLKKARRAPQWAKR